MKPWQQLALLSVALVSLAFMLVGASCYDASKKYPCDPHCADMPSPVGWHRYKWERDKLRDAGYDVQEPYGAKP